MAYVLRKVNYADEEFFLNSGAISPFGKQRFGFAYEMVENVNDDIRMIFIGGQGSMTEDGRELSDMAHYCLVIWEKKWFVVEFFIYKKYKKNSENKTVYIVYKIKAVHSCVKDCVKKDDFINVVKECLIAYGDGKVSETFCKVSFIDKKVRWE